MILETGDLKSAQISKLVIMNAALDITEVDSDAYLSSGAIEKILSRLKEKSAGTKIQYLTVISGLLKKYGYDNKAYCRAMSVLKKEDAVTDLSHQVELLHKLLKSPNPDIRLLAGIIVYKVDQKVTLSNTIRTSTKDRGLEFPYLNITECTWTVYSDSHAKSTVPISAEFIEHIVTIKGPSDWLIEHEGLRKYYDVRRISELFSKALGVPFLQMRSYFMSLDKKIESPEKPRILIVSRGERSLDVHEMCSRLDRLRGSTVKKYEYNILKLQELAIGRHGKLMIDRLCTKEACATLLSKLDGKNPHTVYSLLSPMSRILEMCSDMNPEYYRWFYELTQKYRDICNALPKKKVPDFRQLQEEMKRLVNNVKVPRSVRVMLLVIIHGIDDGDDDIGVLRISDIINTKFGYDEEYSYLDMATKAWYIRAQYTKNKVERKLTLSDGFIEGLKAIYSDLKPQWLVFIEKEGRKMERYKTSASLSEAFITRMGLSVTDVRASYATYLYENYPQEKGQKMAYNMGHDYRTVMQRYIRTDAMNVSGDVVGNVTEDIGDMEDIEDDEE
jgi:hypothetical protein